MPTMSSSGSKRSTSRATRTEVGRHCALLELRLRLLVDQRRQQHLPDGAPLRPAFGGRRKRHDLHRQRRRYLRARSGATTTPTATAPIGRPQRQPAHASVLRRGVGRVPGRWRSQADCRTTARRCCCRRTPTARWVRRRAATAERSSWTRTTAATSSPNIRRWICGRSPTAGAATAASRRSSTWHPGRWRALHRADRGRQRQQGSLGRRRPVDLDLCARLRDHQRVAMGACLRSGPGTRPPPSRAIGT